MNQHLTEDQIKQAVREGYTKAVTAKSCCSTGAAIVTLESKRTKLTHLVGYTTEELDKLPESAVESAFGCGNPLAFAEVEPGDVVLDIGSGAGIDCLIAAEKVGPTGRVIGLDMTPAMIEKARENARKAGVANVEFRLGDAEDMPVEDAGVDWIVSNCVINLAPNKRKVFGEVARALKPGGRVSISDIVLDDDLPEAVVQNIDAMVGCVAGAVKEADYLAAMQAAGLVDVAVTSRLVYSEEQMYGFLASKELTWGDEAGSLWAKHRDRIVGNVWSAKITARKP
jgi:SAM-dependent methyltransferase